MKYQVLIIDDSEDIFELMTSFLSPDHFVLKYAADGQLGLTALREGFVPTLIIVDYSMEVMDGPQFLLSFETEFPELLKSIPVVLFTGHNPSSLLPNRATEVVQKKGFNILGILNKYCPVPGKTL